MPNIPTHADEVPTAPATTGLAATDVEGALAELAGRTTLDAAVLDDDLELVFDADLAPVEQES